METPMSDEHQNLVTQYVQAMHDYDVCMRIAKTTKSTNKRQSAAYTADKAYKIATAIKGKLAAVGITVHRSL